MVSGGKHAPLDSWQRYRLAQLFTSGGIEQHRADSAARPAAAPRPCAEAAELLRRLLLAGAGSSGHEPVLRSSFGMASFGVTSRPTAELDLPQLLAEALDQGQGLTHGEGPNYGPVGWVGLAEFVEGMAGAGWRLSWRFCCRPSAKD